MRGHPFGIIYMRLSFAGRNSELEQLRTLYLQGRHVLIVGPPGIGKTALLNEFRTRALLLVCKGTSKLTSICSGLEQELGRSHHGLSVFERKRRWMAARPTSCIRRRISPRRTSGRSWSMTIRRARCSRPISDSPQSAARKGPLPIPIPR